MWARRDTGVSAGPHYLFLKIAPDKSAASDGASVDISFWNSFEKIIKATRSADGTYQVQFPNQPLYVATFNTTSQTIIFTGDPTVWFPVFQSCSCSGTATSLAKQPLVWVLGILFALTLIGFIVVSRRKKIA